MFEFYGHGMADPDYYAPLHRVTDPGHPYTPSAQPAGWTAQARNIWTLWRPAADSDTPAQGWKVHVSARLDRADAVLDEVARVCFAEGVVFKHLATELFFIVMHHKHGPRTQAGKFCAAYPPDESAARRLLDRLTAALAGEEGPYILTDRRYRTSSTVQYRYGAFEGRMRLLPDGTRQSLVRDGSGKDTIDVRRPSSVLPAGISDPFIEERPADTTAGPVVLHGFEVVRALQLSNAGGAYEGREPGTGRRVFIKEARAHNGLYWDRTTARQRLRREYEVLVALDRAAPGSCPAPLAHFREWEHDFLVTEFIEGQTLVRWVATQTPIIKASDSPAEFVRYHDRCRRILADLDRTLRRIHQQGYRFGDVNALNVMVCADDSVRLIDFEAASQLDEPSTPMGTDGYVPPEEFAGEGPTFRDEYGMAAVALALLMPLHAVMQRSPGNLPLLRRDLEWHAPVPDWLWDRATRFHPTVEADPLPDPEALDHTPHDALARFATEVQQGLLATADADHPDRIFPTTPRGYNTNTLCVAHGTAGVLHALHVTGATVPTAILDRFRREATDASGELPPGLHIGSAGVGWVLAELGWLEEAVTLVDQAAAHPLAQRSTTLGEGRAGIGMTQLYLYRHTGEQRFLDAAVHAGDDVLGVTDLAATLGPNDAVGLLHGRAGLALFLYHLARHTGEPRYLTAGLGLLYAELDRGLDLPDGALSFPDDAKSRRAMPYLYAGTAGVVTVATRYLAAAPDERLAQMMPRMLRDITKPCTIMPGLYCGLGGLVFGLAEHAGYSGDPDRRAAAVRVATGLVKYAVPGPTGVRFLGDGGHRYSAELFSGAAGVLLALHRIIVGPADQFFTLDHPRPRLVCLADPQLPGRVSTGRHATADTGRR